MKNFLKIVFAITATSLILACSLTSASTPATDQQNVATIVAGTIQALTVTAPLATQAAPTQALPTNVAATQAAPTQAVPTQPNGIPITISNVSFVIPKGLASGAAGQQVQAIDETSGAPWDVAPTHLEITLNGYDNTLGTFGTIKIWVYPAQEYAAVYNGASNSLQRLNAILANPPAPITKDNLPQVPSFNAAQVFASNVQVINFQNGKGVRMVTQYDQAIMPIANDATFYHFEGLTSDGKYYIVAVLPIGSLVLQSSENSNTTVPAGGVPFPDTANMNQQTFNTYIQSVTDKLNAQVAADGFAPSIAQLDALIQSITITQ